MSNDQLIREAVDKAIADLTKEMGEMIGTKILRVSHNGEKVEVENINTEDFYAPPPQEGEE